MTVLRDAPLIGPGSELQPTIDGGAAAHGEVVAETVLAPAAAAVELVDGLEVGEEAEALELDLALARAGAEENLYVAGEEPVRRRGAPGRAGGVASDAEAVRLDLQKLRRVP